MKKNKLQGLKILITMGPTIEKIDPVRYISNYSSGKQGYYIAQGLADLGAKVILVSGPVSIAINKHKNIKLIKIETAKEMLKICEENLPVDIGIFVAAVCDFRPKKILKNKIKKQLDENEINLNLVKNPDILKTIATHKERPKIVVGFAAESENLLANATKKLQEKSCDLVVANDIAKNKVFGDEENKVTFVFNKDKKITHLDLPLLAKKDVALFLADFLADCL